MSFEVNTETVQRLMAVGYLATGSGMHREAEIIFHGVQAARPESEYPAIGRAVTNMNAGRSDKAVAVLQETSEHSESDLVKSFLGVALHQADLQGESRRVMEEVVESNCDEVAVRMAASMLNPSDD